MRLASGRDMRSARLLRGVGSVVGGVAWESISEAAFAVPMFSYPRLSLLRSKLAKSKVLGCFSRRAYDISCCVGNVGPGKDDIHQKTNLVFPVGNSVFSTNKGCSLISSYRYFIRLRSCLPGFSFNGVEATLPVSVGLAGSSGVWDCVGLSGERK
jgi:hypothetical protein